MSELVRRTELIGGAEEDTDGATSAPPAGRACLVNVRVAFSGFSEADSIPFDTLEADTQTTEGKGHHHRSAGKAELASRHHDPSAPVAMPSLTKLQTWASACGAQVEGLSRRTDVLVTWRGLTAKRFAAEARGIPVVSPEWFLQATQELAADPATSEIDAPPAIGDFKQLLHTSSTCSSSMANSLSRVTPPGPLPWLYGYVFNTTQIPPSERNALRRVIERHGGQLTPTLNGRCDALLISSEYAAAIKEVNSSFQRLQRMRAVRDAEEQRVQDAEGRTQRRRKKKERNVRATQEARLQEEQARQERAARDAQEDAHLVAKARRLFSEKLRAAWEWEIPVLNYEKLLAMANLTASSVTTMEVPLDKTNNTRMGRGGAHNGNAFGSGRHGTEKGDRRADYDTICETTCILPARGLLTQLLSSDTAGRLPIEQEETAHTAKRLQNPFIFNDEAPDRGAAVRENDDTEDSHSIATSSSETTASLVSSFHDYAELGEEAFDMGWGETVGEPDGFTQTPEITSPREHQHFQPQKDPSAATLKARAGEGQPVSTGESTLTSQFADALTLPEENQVPEPLSAKDIVREYYIKMDSTNPMKTTREHHISPASASSFTVAPQRISPFPAGTSTDSFREADGAITGMSSNAWSTVQNHQFSSHQHQQQQDQQRVRRTNADPMHRVQSAVRATIPFYLHEPPFLHICFVGCTGKERRDAARMAHACRFLVMPIPTATDTDLVVLGSAVLSKKVYMAPLPFHVNGEEGKHQKEAAGGLEKKGRSAAPLPLRQAAAAAREARLEEMAERRRRLRRMRRLEQGNAVVSESERESDTSGAVCFYEVSYALAEGLRERCGVPTHRLAPLSWLRACYRKVIQKQQKKQQRREKRAVAAIGAAGTIGEDGVTTHARAPAEDEEASDSDGRATYGFGETFTEGGASFPSDKKAPHPTTPLETLTDPFAMDPAAGRVEAGGRAEGDDAREQNSEAEETLAFDPEPVLSEEEMPLPTALPFRVVVARPSSSALLRNHTANGDELTAPQQNPKNDEVDGQDGAPAGETKKEEGKHTNKTNGTVGRRTKDTSTPAPATASLSTGAAGPPVTAPPPSEEDIQARELAQSRAILNAFMALLQPTSRLFVDRNESNTATTSGRAFHCEASSLFAHLLFCFTEGDYARPFVGATRALIKLGRGHNLKLTEDAWRASIASKGGKRNGVVDGVESGDARGPSIDAVKKCLIYGKRKRDVFGSVLAHTGDTTPSTAPMPGAVSRDASRLDAGMDEPFSPVLDAGEVSSSPSFLQSSVPSFTSPCEDTMCAGTDEASVLQPVTHKRALANANSLKKLTADAAAVQRVGTVALRLRPHAHERGASSVPSLTPATPQSSWKPSLRYLPGVTTDYLLACLAAGRLVSVTSCFVFSTPLPTPEEAMAAVLARRHQQNAVAAAEGLTTLPLPPPLSAWQGKRRYEKRHVGIAVSFLWILPKNSFAGVTSIHEGTETEPSDGKKEEGAEEKICDPQGNVMAMMRVLLAALSRVVEEALGATVCPHYNSEEVTHAIVVDVAAILSSSLADCFLYVTASSIAHTSVADGQPESSGNVPADAPTSVTVWPPQEARAAVVDALRNKSCVVSDRWLRDCLAWNGFIDERARPDEYQRVNVIRELIAKEETGALPQLPKALHATPIRGKRPRGPSQSPDATARSVDTPRGTPQAGRNTEDPSRATEHPTPRSALQKFHFNTPGSTPIVSRLPPREAITGQADPHALASPLPSQPIPVSQQADAMVRRSSARAHPPRSLRAASASQNANLYSPSRQADLHNRVSVAATFTGVRGGSTRHVSAESPFDELSAAMELRRSMDVTRRSASRASHHQNLPDEKESKGFFAERGSPHASRCRESTPGVPQLILSSTDNSLSNPPASFPLPSAWHEAVDRRSTKSDDAQNNDCEAMAADRPDPTNGNTTAVMEAHPQREEPLHSGPTPGRLLARCSYQMDSKDASPHGKAIVAEGNAVTLSLAAPSTPSLRRAREEPDKATLDTEAAAQSTRATATTNARSTVGETEKEDGASADAEGSRRKAPRLAYVTVSPPPRREDAFLVDDDEELPDAGNERGDGAGGKTPSGGPSEGVAPDAPSGKGDAPLETRRVPTDTAHMSSARLSLYLLSDLPGRETLLKQYKAIVKRLMPTLPASSKEASAPEEQEGPLVFVSALRDADCLVSHELTQRESVLAAIAAGLWVVRPAFLTTVMEHMRKTRHCDAYMRKSSPVLIRLLELHEWSPLTLPTSRSPTPPPAPAPLQGRGQGDRDRDRSVGGVREADLKRALAQQCVHRRRLRSQQMELHRKEKCEGRAPRTGLFSDEVSLIFFPPFDPSRKGTTVCPDGMNGMVEAVATRTTGVTTTSSSSSGNRRADEASTLSNADSDAKSTAVAQLGLGEGACESAADGPTGDTSNSFAQAVNKKKDSIRAVLACGGARVAFAGLLNIPPTTKEDGSTTRAPIVNVHHLVEQLTCHLLRAFLMPLYQNPHRSNEATSRPVTAVRPTLAEKRLYVMFDSRLLTQFFVHVNDREGATLTVAAWLRRLLHDPSGRTGAPVPAAPQDDDTTAQARHVIITAMQAARQLILASFANHQRMYRAAHPDEDKGPDSEGIASAWASTTDNGLSAPPVGGGRVLQKLALVEQEPNRRRCVKPPAPSSSKCALVSPIPVDNTTNGFKIFERVRKECEEACGGRDAGETTCDMAVYQAPTVVCFRDVSCVALEIMNMAEAYEDASRHFGSIFLASP